MNLPTRDEICIFVEMGATLVNLEFYKKFDNDVVKLVKLKVNREKVLELKTLFVKD